jgi:hypothetical protein
MKKLRFVLCLLPLIILTVSGCVGNQAPVTAGLGESLTLAVGQSVQITGEDLQITFNEIIGDSRCPEGVQCIWAGVVNCRMTVVYKGKTYSQVLKQSGAAAEAEDTFVNYNFKFNVTPYPTEGQTIAVKEYRLTMTVTK